MIKKIILSLTFLISSQYCFSMSGYYPSPLKILNILKIEFANQTEYKNFESFATKKLSESKEKFPCFSNLLDPEIILKQED
jgi:hypothetical protein